MSRGDGIIILLSCLFLSLHLSTHLFLAHLDLELANDEIGVVGELKKCLDLLVRIIQISEAQFGLDDRVLDIDRILGGLKGHKRGLLFFLELAGVEHLS